MITAGVCREVKNKTYDMNNTFLALIAAGVSDASSADICNSSSGTSSIASQNVINFYETNWISRTSRYITNTL